MYRPKSVEKQIEKISGRLNKNRSPLSIEPENRYGSGKPGRNESQRTWSDNTVASHSKQKGPLCQTWMDVDWIANLFLYASGYHEESVGWITSYSGFGVHLMTGRVDVVKLLNLTRENSIANGSISCQIKKDMEGLQNASSFLECRWNPLNPLEG